MSSIKGSLLKHTVLLFILFFSCQAPEQKTKIAVVISANSEWRVVKDVFPENTYNKSPWGEYFFEEYELNNNQENVLFFHGGWGKVAASASTQYVIDKWDPDYLINIGTCGGFEGDINRFDVILVNKTIIYDIVEQMGNSSEAVEYYSTEIDLEWLGRDLPTDIIISHLLSADKDIVASEIPGLKKQYDAIAADWETGGIAYVAVRNNKKVIILRGVSDLVGDNGGEAYGNIDVFVKGTKVVMKKLISDLPLWMERCK